MNKGNSRGEKELLRCLVCGDYFAEGKGFSCPACRRGPLCKKHILRGRKECVSCTVDLKLKELRTLRQQVLNISHFIRFLQFVAVFVGVYFFALKYRLLESMDLSFLEENFFADNMITMGVGVLLILGGFYFVRFKQHKKADEIESEIAGIKREMG